MNIVFIGPFGWQPKATLRTRALWLGQALVERGHTVTMLIPPWDDPDRAGQRWVDQGVQVINMSLPVGVPLLFQTLLTRTLVNQALALQPDVIHFFKPKAYAGLAHWALWWLRRIKGSRVRLVLDTDDWERAWNELSAYTTLQKWFFSWQEKWGLSHADAITVASRALEGLVQPYAGPTPVVYVPNGGSQEAITGFLEWGSGFDSDRAAAVRRKWQLDDAPIILLYSRFLEFRLERIVNLVRYVAAQIPEARWLMVGQGLQGEAAKLQTLLTEAGLSALARFTGWLPLEDVPTYFQIADVAIYPYDDTLINRTKCSVKLIDLLLAGLPVVADAVGQNCEYIQTGVSGILTPAEDDAAFAEAIVKLLQEPATRRKLGQAARQTIQEKFSWSNLSQQVEQVYL